MNSAVLSAVRITEIPVCIVEGDKSGANYSYTSRVENYGFLSYWCHRCILAAHRRRCRLERLSVRLPLRDLPCSVTPPPPQTRISNRRDRVLMIILIMKFIHLYADTVGTLQKRARKGVLGKESRTNEMQGENFRSVPCLHHVNYILQDR